MTPLPAPFACPACPKHPAFGAPVDPCASSVSIFAYLRDQAHWSPDNIRKLGEYLIEHCGGDAAQTVGSSTREKVLNCFANHFQMDSGSFLKSEQLDESFCNTLDISGLKMSLPHQLNEAQATYISRVILGDPATENIKANERHGGKLDVYEFAYQVLRKIRQSADSHYTIRQFLNSL